MTKKQNPGVGPVRAAYHRRIKTAIADGTLHQCHAADAIVRSCRDAKISLPRGIPRPIAEAMILGALANRGGQIVKDQRALQDLLATLPFPGMHPVVAELEKADLIVVTKHQGGRSTDAIALTASGWEWIGNAAPGKLPADYHLPDFEPGGRYSKHRAPAPSTEDPAVAREAIAHAVRPAPADPDLGQDDHYDDPVALARLCIRLGIERDEARERLAQAEANVDILAERLARAAEEVDRLRALVPEATPAASNGQSDYTVRGRLRESERADLDRLMKEVPTG